MITVSLNYNDDEIIIDKDGKSLVTLSKTKHIAEYKDFVEKLFNAMSDDGHGLMVLEVINEDSRYTVDEW